jgi:hypothetical protein
MKYRPKYRLTPNPSPGKRGLNERNHKVLSFGEDLGEALNDVTK